MKLADRIKDFSDTNDGNEVAFPFCFHVYILYHNHVVNSKSGWRGMFSMFRYDPFDHLVLLHNFRISGDVGRISRHIGFIVVRMERSENARRNAQTKQANEDLGMRRIQLQAHLRS